MEDIGDKLNAIREECGTLQDTPEAYMAELRLDLGALQDHIANISEMVQSQETRFYNYKLGLTILSVFVFILYLIS
jgi:hypothetical protein